jgi:regulator of protease activity HflC (stomatin/prohibitin superfamily)
MKVDAVLYYNVVNPEHAIIQVESYRPATNMPAQTPLRAVLGQHDLDEMLSERKKLGADVQWSEENPDLIDCASPAIQVYKFPRTGV